MNNLYQKLKCLNEKKGRRKKKIGRQEMKRKEEKDGKDWGGIARMMTLLCLTFSRSSLSLTATLNDVKNEWGIVRCNEALNHHHSLLWGKIF